MNLLDGKVLSQEIREEIKKEVAVLVDAGKRAPHLAAVLVGNDPASETYVASKQKNCAEVGMTSSLYRLDAGVSENELLKTIEFLNNDPEVDGFIVQLPLPKHINEDKIIAAIDPLKDVDGFHPENLGKMLLGLETFIPATPYGIMEMLRRAGIDTVGKNAVVIGRSHIVGSPMSVLLSRNTNPGNCTVTTCHSKTADLEFYTRNADIIVAAVGKAGFLKEEMVKDGAVIVDVGIHRIEDASRQSGFRIVGDVDFENVSKKASWITPVPGGVGLMTIAGLLMNTLKAYKNK